MLYSMTAAFDSEVTNPQFNASDNAPRNLGTDEGSIDSILGQTWHSFLVIGLW
jgi:hypothetical protein